MRKSLGYSKWFLLAACLSALAAFAQDSSRTLPRRGYFTVKPAPGAQFDRLTNELRSTGSSASSGLPLWLYNVESSRDHNDYTGVMVGADPFTRGGNKNVSVRTYVVPLIVITNQVITAINFNTGHITSKPGETTFDPTVPNVCLAAPNNVPTTLVAQSPILTPAPFHMGKVSVGVTQYNDAFQRGNFWQVLGENGTRDDYHMKLGPVKFLDPLLINVPAAYGTAGVTPGIFGPPPICPPFGIIDINWFDSYLTSKVLPALAAQGVNPSNFPIFLLSNVVMASPVSQYFSCCILGYHGTTGFPIQTYSPAAFDSSLFFAPPDENTDVLSHEVDEWMDDPFGNNPVPAWGHTGQQPGCQNNLEVGDPLSGTPFPPVKMPNGFTYNLQELAFFSWFFGAPSVGVNGWYSDNGTFKNDAGPPCQ